MVCVCVPRGFSLGPFADDNRIYDLARDGNSGKVMEFWTP